MTVFVQRTDGKLDYTFDWSDDIDDPVTLLSVTHTASDDLSVESELTDADNQLSTVFLTGGTHGRHYFVKALATLSNGLLIPSGVDIVIFEAS